jgi:oligoribonuclease NrnB/cAMP/cGMP phosphodiesterase (DHH superfamily)
MSEILVCYHGSCPDGFTSAWSAWTALGNTATYLPVSYGGEAPDVTGKRVYIVDFSFKRDVLIDMASKAESIVLLDHHKTAEADLKDLDVPGLEIHFDMNQSGAGLTWNYFHSEGNWLVDYIEDRDLWKFSLPDSKVVNAYLGSLPHDFETFSRVYFGGVKKAKLAGEGCLAWVRYYVENTKKTATKMRFLGHDNIPVVNCPYSAISEVVGELSEGHEFAIGWQWKDGNVHYSLRSTHGFDVSALAQTMGGGGHRAASGFRSDKLPWEISEAQL